MCSEVYVVDDNRITDYENYVLSDAEAMIMDADEFIMAPWNICPAYVDMHNPSNGAVFKVPKRCNSPMCPNCRGLRALKKQARAINAFHSHEELVYAIVESESEVSQEMHKKLRKPEHWSVPMESGQTFHLVTREAAEKFAGLSEFKPFTQEFMNTFDYEKLISPTRSKHGKGGKQESGSLGGKTPKTVKNAEDVINAEMVAYMYDASEEVRAEIEEEVQILTENFDPQNLEEAIKMANERSHIAIRIIRERGIKVEVSKYFLKLNKNVSIKWNKNRNNSSPYVWKTGVGNVKRPPEG